jgi:beta-D-xylosidase 4
VTAATAADNAVNGVPSCANDWLLNEVARDEWGFDGYVTSDCDADNDVVFSHHFTDDPNQGVADVLKAGTDVDCGGFVGKYVASALGNNTITEADIDERLEKLFRVRMRLSHFDPVGPLQGIGADSICNQYSFDLSQDGPAQSSTLLKNDAKTLPLASSSCGTVAVIGPNANLSESDSGYYGPHNVCAETPGAKGPPKFWTLVDAVTKAGASKVVSDNAIPNVLSNSTAGIADAVTMAKSADTVILAVGTDLSWAAEGHDAKSIAFTDAQKELVSKCADAAKKPIIVVIMTATPLDISEMLANPKVGAIVHTGQPSVTMLGVGDVLFGKKPPAGRMIQTIYPESYMDEISIFDFNMRPGPSAFVRPDCDQKCDAPPMHGGPCGSCPMGTNPGRTHRFYTGKAVTPFGYGLSYTTFSYDLKSAPTGTVSLDAVRDMIAQTKSDGRIFPAHALLGAAAPLVNYEVNVTNTGSVDSDEVVLGFLKPPGAGTNGVPLQQLYGFERVHVPAGKTVLVQLYPSLADFSQVDGNGERYDLPGEYTFHFGVGGEHAGTKGMGYAEHKITMV